MRLAQEKIMEKIERTEVAGDTIYTTTNHQGENIMETNSSINVTIPMKTVMDALLKDEAVVSVIYDKMKDDIESLVNSSLVDSVESAVEDKMSDYVMEDDIWDKIEGDVEQRIADSETSGIDEGWIQENLETYTSQNAGNQCRLGKAVWDAIVYTVRGDITLHWAEVNRGETNFSRVAGVDTFMSDLVRLIEIVSERTTINVIEQEKQKYLANRNEYLENPVSASLVDSETKITVSQFQEFINSLDLFQETKDSILNKFSTTRIKFQQ